MDSTKCPICGKADIPDFLQQDTKCPCCGSDLSIFRKIDQIPDDDKKASGNKAWKLISMVAVIAAIGLGFYALQSKPSNVVPEEYASKITMLEDSISRLNERQNALTPNQPLSDSPKSGFQYVVRPGDSWWSISRRVYGTGTRYEEIMKYNNATTDTKLKVGDSIIIK